MLQQLYLGNFRGFRDHILPIKPTTIIVGKNNAGKSTIVEALRILSLVVTRFQSRSVTFAEVPLWLERPRNYKGVSPSIQNIDINVDSLFHNLGDPPAELIATFSNGSTIEIHIGFQGKIHAVARNESGQIITTRNMAKTLQIPTVSILPQISPVSRDEKILSTDYVRASLASSLAPLHFRNQIKIFFEYYPEFKLLAESTWPDLRIIDLEGRQGLPGELLALIIKDKEFAAEVVWMGHGLQMWLQTMWFLARCRNSNSIILDEPDVYMHADLQRRLIRLLKGRHEQVIIATHSIEIMAEVEPDQLLVVDRARHQSSFTSSLPAVQRVIDNIGGVHNVQLARLWSARKCLLVEGNDIAFLKILQNILFPKSLEPFDLIPNMSIGGWGGWNYAIGSSMLSKNAIGDEITMYCIFDSDYHTETEKNKRKEEARRHGIQLHIWKKKEIENYALVPNTILRVVLSEMASDITAPTVEELEEQIDIIVQPMKEKILIDLGAEYQSEDRAGGFSKAHQRANEHIDKYWSTREGRRSLAKGKDIRSALSSWSQKSFGVTFGAAKLFRAMRQAEIDPELAEVVTAIEKSLRFQIQ